MGGVGRPELLGDPGDLRLFQGDAVVRGGLADVVQGHDVVVDHVVLVAVVVVFDGGLAVVRGVDVDAVVEGVGRRVGDVDVGYERLFVGHDGGCVIVG